MTQKQIAAPQLRASLDEFFAAEEQAEQAIRAKLPFIATASFLIASRDLMDLETETEGVEDCDAVMSTLTKFKEKMTHLLALVTQRDSLPVEIFNVGWDPLEVYSGIWDESVTLIDDTLLFISAYREGLVRDSAFGEDQERQRTVRDHLLYVMEAVLEALLKIPSWRSAVRQDAGEKAGFVEKAGGQQ